MRDHAGRFAPGTPGGPGRKKGSVNSPLIKAKKIILDIFMENQELFANKLKEVIVGTGKNEGILKYYENFVVPFMPAVVNLEVSAESADDNSNEKLEMIAQLTAMKIGEQAKNKLDEFEQL